MPSTRVWTGTTSAWTTDANWTAATYPADGDTALFTGDSVHDVDGVTPGTSNDQLAAVYIHPNYSGQIGTSGGKVILNSITTFRMASRGGAAFFDATITNAILTASGGITNFCELDGTITNLYAAGCAGSWSVTSGAAVTNLFQSDSPNCTCTINASVTGLNKVICTSGRMVNNSAVSGTTIPGGYTYVASSQYEQIAGAMANLIVGQGGYVRYKSSGTAALVQVLPGGVFDGRENVSSTVAITAIYSYPGSQIFLNTGLDNFTGTLYKVGGGGMADLESINAVTI